MKHLAAIALSICLSIMLHAQRPDTLACGADHSFSARQIVVPSALFATGATITATPWLRENVNVALRDWVQSDGHPRNEIEDYIQYSPIAAAFILKGVGLESQHGYRDMFNLCASTALLQVVICNGLKYSIGFERPYGGVYNSFPSGHTMTAFMGAEILRREYGKEYPIVPICGYTVATGVGLMRIYNNRHWAGDVIAGAGLGILCASLSYWISPYLRF